MTEPIQPTDGTAANGAAANQSLPTSATWSHSPSVPESNHGANLSQGRSHLGQLISLKAGAKVAINAIAQEMVRPSEHIDAIIKSIAEVGQLTPCVVIQLAESSYQLLAGVTRKTACDKLEIACKCVVLDKMTVEEANAWVAQERVASRNQRHLNAAQKALDGARLCQEVYEPAAKARKLTGQAAIGETGKSTELAATACGISAASVKTARKILGTPAEQLVKEGLLKTLSTAKKIAALPSEQQQKAANSYREGRMEEFQELVGGNPKTTKDKLGIEIPAGSPLRELFDAASVFDKQVASLATVAKVVRELRELDSATDELSAIDLDKLQAVSNQIAASRPYALCPVCDLHGSETECVWCQGRRWLTAKRTGQFEVAQQEAIKKVRPK